MWQAQPAASRQASASRYTRANHVPIFTFAQVPADGSVGFDGHYRLNARTAVHDLARSGHLGGQS